MTERELKDPNYLRQARRFLSDLEISKGEARDTFLNWYSEFDYRGGKCIGTDGERVDLDTSVFEPLEPEEHKTLPNDRAEPMPDPFPDWYESFATPVPAGVFSYLTKGTRDRASVLLTIVRARFPGIDSYWASRPCTDRVAA